MHPNFHPKYNIQTADFWFSSYEYALDCYARTELALHIDEQLIIPDDLNVCLEETDSTVLIFTLERNGRIKDCKDTNPSKYTELDKLAEKALLKASPLFPRLPKGSAAETKFELEIDFGGSQVSPTLYNEEQEFALDLQRSLGYDHARFTCGLELDRDKVVLVPLPPKDSHQTQSLEKLSCVISRARIPDSFPVTTSFVLSLEKLHTSVESYVRWRPFGFDKHDRNNAERRGHHYSLILRPELAKTDKWVDEKPNDVVRHCVKATRLYSCEGFDSAMNYADGIIRRFPDETYGYITLSQILQQEFMRRCDNPEFAEKAIAYCKIALTKTNPGKEHYDYIWLLMGSVYAATGNYDEFLKCVQNMKGGYNNKLTAGNKSALHSKMAFYFERVGYWEMAIGEWNECLKLTEPEDAGHNNAKESLQFCRDQLERLGNYVRLEEWPNLL